MEDADNRDRIRQLYELYGDEIYRYALYTLLSEEDAKDVVQEVFIRIFLGWGEFRGDSSVKTWILRVTRNYIYDLLRKRKADMRRQKALEQVFRQQYDSFPLDLEFLDTLRALPAKYRDVLLLRCVEGLTAAEVGQVMGVSENNVRVLFHRAKKCLQALLEESNTDVRERG
ncbi:MAG: RNA polymerase sigma factor [Alicyclobacillus sp.]|nr:RNA polymerase sigma factor [Alicyclobacillus sp.]